jgi:uncharacterized membrane protein YidH (DUF202 family)
MPLKTRPKPPAYARKRQGGHHNRNKRYVKPYLPYLPMLIIVGLGVLLNKIWAPGAASADSLNSSIANTRLAVITHSKSYGLVYIVLAITFAAFAVLVVAHWYRFHRLLNRGEMFIVKHPWFDVSLVLIVTAGILLTRS